MEEHDHREVVSSPISTKSRKRTKNKRNKLKRVAIRQVKWIFILEWINTDTRLYTVDWQYIQFVRMFTS